jgi:hypothetical protein
VTDNDSADFDLPATDPRESGWWRDNEPSPTNGLAYDGRHPAWGTPDLTLLGTGRRPTPAFPLELLRPFWSAWASRKAHAASSPVDYVAVSLLAAIGAGLANVRWPLAGASWSEPPVLWCGLVGSPSCGKSPSMECGV